MNVRSSRRNSIKRRVGSGFNKQDMVGIAMPVNILSISSAKYGLKLSKTDGDGGSKSNSAGFINLPPVRKCVPPSVPPSSLVFHHHYESVCVEHAVNSPSLQAASIDVRREDLLLCVRRGCWDHRLWQSDKIHVFRQFGENHVGDWQWTWTIDEKRYYGVRWPGDGETHWLEGSWLQRQWDVFSCEVGWDEFSDATVVCLKHIACWPWGRDMTYFGGVQPRNAVSSHVVRQISVSKNTLSSPCQWAAPRATGAMRAKQICWEHLLVCHLSARDIWSPNMHDLDLRTYHE